MIFNAAGVVRFIDRPGPVKGGRHFESRDNRMQTRNRRRTFTVGDCTFSCESRIFTFVMAEAAPERPLRAVRAPVAKPARTRRRRAKRAA